MTIWMWSPLQDVLNVTWVFRSPLKHFQYLLWTWSNKDETKTILFTSFNQILVLPFFCFFLFVFSCARSRGGVPPLHAAVPRGAAPRGAPPSRAPTSRGRGVQRARGAPPPAGYRPAPPIVQETYGEYVSTSAHAEIRRTLGAVNSADALVKLPISTASILAERQQWIHVCVRWSHGCRLLRLWVWDSE